MSSTCKILLGLFEKKLRERTTLLPREVRDGILLVGGDLAIIAASNEIDDSTQEITRGITGEPNRLDEEVTEEDDRTD